KVADADKVHGMDKAAWWTVHANMPGVLNWALAGLKRLRENGYRFTRPARCEEAKHQLRLESNPTLLFITERLVADPAGREIVSSELYTNYREWCGNSGYMPLSSGQFAKEVQRACKGARSKPRTVQGKSVRYWHGLRCFDPARDLVWGVM